MKKEKSKIKRISFGYKSKGVKLLIDDYDKDGKVVSTRGKTITNISEFLKQKAREGINDNRK